MCKRVPLWGFLGLLALFAATPALACNIVPGHAPTAADCSQPTVLVNPTTGAPITPPSSSDLAPLSTDAVSADLSITANSQHNVVDAGAAGGISLTVTGTFTATFQVQWSNKSAGTYVAGICYAAGNTGTSAASASITTTGQYVCPKAGRYADITSTAYTSGTATVTPALMAQRPPFPVIASSQPVAMSNAFNATSPGLAAPLAAQCDDTSPQAETENSWGAGRIDCLNHAVIYKPYESSANQWSYAAATSGIVNTTTAVTMKAAAGAGLRNYLTSCQVSTDTLGAATELAIRDGAAGTVVWRHKLPTTAVQGLQVTFPVPLRGTANTLTEVVTLTAVTGGVYVDCQGYIAP